MRRWLPFPLISLALLALWLLLNQSLAPGHLIFGACLAIGGALMLSVLEIPKAHLRRPGVILALAWVVFVDIVRSNIAVARIILGRPLRKGASGFVSIPIEMTAPYGLAALAIIITSTPGTLWTHFDSDKKRLTIHVLDLVNEDVWIATVKQRYERRLMEIFE